MPLPGPAGLHAGGKIVDDDVVDAIEKRREPIAVSRKIELLRLAREARGGLRDDEAVDAIGKLAQVDVEEIEFVVEGKAVEYPRHG